MLIDTLKCCVLACMDIVHQDCGKIHLEKFTIHKILSLRIVHKVFSILDHILNLMCLNNNKIIILSYDIPFNRTYTHCLNPIIKLTI